MLLLFCLIFRAVSLEFRGKVHSDAWRRMWDFAFFASSLTASLLFGVAVGNGLAGIPLNERGLTRAAVRSGLMENRPVR
jgi:cytochrome d ubiquinol oxidase subunit II